jgi:hypothetical protein
MNDAILVVTALIDGSSAETIPSGEEPFESYSMEVLI